MGSANASHRRFGSTTMGRSSSRNGSDLVCGAGHWCYIQPRKPDQNAFIERYNRTYRTEVFNAYVFELLEQLRKISAEWLQRYNEERPHDAADLPPATYGPNLRPEVLLCHRLLDEGA